MGVINTNKKTNKVLFVFIMLLVCLCAVNFIACETVVPAAWVSVNTEGGYFRYTTDMYGSASAHIYCYDDEELQNKAFEITFSPRILGPEEVEGKKTTLVDVSGKYAMYITIYKASSIYSETKSFYLNGAETPLVPTKTDDYETLVYMEFNDFGLVRGNPNGKINGVINTLEYK